MLTDKYLNQVVDKWIIRINCCASIETIAKYFRLCQYYSKGTIKMSWYWHGVWNHWSLGWFPPYQPSASCRPSLRICYRRIRADHAQEPQVRIDCIVDAAESHQGKCQEQNEVCVHPLQARNARCMVAFSPFAFRRLDYCHDRRIVAWGGSHIEPCTPMVQPIGCVGAVPR